MSFVNSNWAQIVKQHKVDPVNPAGQLIKKRKLSHPNSSQPPHTNSDDSKATHTTDTLASPLQPSSLSSLIRPSPPSSPPTPTLILAMDCEMVGVGPDSTRHSLARCSIVNSLGHVLLDRYVLPLEPVTDYRTAVSGIRPHHLTLTHAHTFQSVQAEVSQLLHTRILVGHGLHSDLSVLLLSHPRGQVRDTTRWKGLCEGRPKGLKVLAKEHLGVDIQQGEHDSVVDARTALALYLKYRKQWELDIKKAKGKGKDQGKGKGKGKEGGAVVEKSAVQVKESMTYTSEGVASPRVMGGVTWNGATGGGRMRGH